MTSTFLKMAAITSIAMFASAGTALAGGDKNCDEKKMKAKQTSAMKADPAAGQTAVMGASEKAMKAKKERVVLSFDDAMKLCTDKGVDDLQACIDYKTGVTKTYKKSTS
ncbi:MAG: hypothetical protein ABJO36_10115 [Litorimonas sp.]